MSETILLDPSAEIDNRTEFDITPFLAAAGPEWGEADATQYLAQGTVGSFSVDYRLENRTATFPLILQNVTGTTFEEARASLQAKAALWQREGGVISRETSVGTVYATVVGAKLTLGGSWMQADREIDLDAVLTVDYIPEWVGAEVELTATGGVSGTGEVITVVSPAAGDHPGPCRIVVTDTSGEVQRGLLWGMRAKHYDSAATAALSYEAEALTRLSGATAVALSGASGGTAVKRASLIPSWSPVVGTDMGGTALTHQGSYRVWARIYSADSTVTPSVRFVWGIPDLATPTENASVTVPSASAFYLADLGEVRLDAPPVGTHQWSGQVEARAATISSNFYVDKLYLFPLDEGYGKLASEIASAGGSLVSYDAFTSTTAGSALNARSAPVGGSWSTSGTTTDYVFSDTADIDGLVESVTRTAVGPRFGLLGTTTSTDVQVESYIAFDGTALSGVLARFVDSSNYAAALIDATSSPGILSIRTVIAGSTTVLTSALLTNILGNDASGALADGVGLRFTIFASGRAVARLFDPATGFTYMQLDTAATTLATGGTLATGKSGIIDSTATAVAARYWTNVSVYTPPPESAIIYGDGVAELRHDGIFRQNEAANAYGQVPIVNGDLPRLPPPGLEARDVQVAVKVTRSDFDLFPDGATDDGITVQVFGRPSYLFVPES